jgi:Flp pilus assembly protein TadD
MQTRYVNGLTIRPLRNGDTATVTALFENLGSRSREKRFCGAKPRLSASELTALARVEGGAEGFRAMWAALLARLGQPPGEDTGVVAGWDALVAAEAAEGRDERAAAALENRIAVKADGGAWVRLGWLRERLGNLAGAEEAYRKALALDAARPAARGGLALVLARQKKHAEAQRLARESVKASPDDADAWIHLGLVLSLAGDARGAGDAYRQAYERARGDAAVLAVIGSSLAEIEQFDLAQKALEASLAADPANGTVLAQAATVAVQREQWPEAKRLLGLASKALPKNAQVAFLQGVVAQRTQQEDAAVQAFRRAVSLDPAEPVYALALAKAYEEKGNVDQALSTLVAAAQECPTNPELQLKLGFLQMQKKRWSLAVESFRRAATLAPKDPDPHLYLAVLYGDHMDLAPQAQQHLEEYQRLGGREATALAWLKELKAAAAKK